MVGRKFKRERDRVCLIVVMMYRVNYTKSGKCEVNV